MLTDKELREALLADPTCNQAHRVKQVEPTEAEEEQPDPVYILFNLNNKQSNEAELYCSWAKSGNGGQHWYLPIFN